jgi:hypothetical protein
MMLDDGILILVGVSTVHYVTNVICRRPRAERVGCVPRVVVAVPWPFPGRCSKADTS